MDTVCNAIQVFAGACVQDAIVLGGGSCGLDHRPAFAVLETFYLRRGLVLQDFYYTSLSCYHS